MQTFKDTETGQEWHFDDDVEVINMDGVFLFKAAHGAVLNVPKTLKPFKPKK